LALECARQSPLLCEGRIRVGWVDPARLRLQRIPADLLALLAGSD
jgi:acyl-CoA thioesterase FadM